MSVETTNIYIRAEANLAGGTPLNNPLIDFCALLSKSKLHF